VGGRIVVVVTVLGSVLAILAALAVAVLVVGGIAFLVTANIYGEAVVWAEPPEDEGPEGTVTMLIGPGAHPRIRPHRWPTQPAVGGTLPLRVCRPEPVTDDEPQYVLYAEGQLFAEGGDVRLSLRESGDTTYFGLESPHRAEVSINRVAVHRSGREIRLELIDPQQPEDPRDDFRLEITATCHPR
jgi:hypothetical protein